MGFGVEPDNRFLHRDVVDFAREFLHEHSDWPTERDEMASEAAYGDVLGHAKEAGKLVARETMGAKSWYAGRLPASPLVFRKQFRAILSCPSKMREWIERAHSAALVSGGSAVMSKSNVL